jgi:hypothetical protein
MNPMLECFFLALIYHNSCLIAAFKSALAFVVVALVVVFALAPTTTV